MAKTTITSPRGIALYVWLTKPDTKFDKDGSFRITLRLAADVAKKWGAEVFKPLMEEALDAAKKAAKTPALAAKITLAKPYKIEEETGDYLFAFKTGAMVKQGETSKPRGPVTVFDAKGKPVLDAKVGSGSEVKVAFTTSPYYIAKDKQAGVSLYLSAVQVLKLVEYNGKDAKGYGFEEEDGYDSENAEAAADETDDTTSDETEASAPEANAGEEDF
jgi:hypothetical protein